MGQIPTAVLSDRIAALVANRRVRAAVFMTYELEPAFVETEVLPLFLTAAGSSPKHRLLQLESALTDDIGPVAVYYDPRGLKEDGTPRLAAVRKFPVMLKSGVFHPKIILLLTEPREPAPKGATTELSVCVASANLTQNGWWKNLECIHIETATAGQKWSLKPGVLHIITQVQKAARAAGDHVALDAIEKFVRKDLEDFERVKTKEYLRPRLIGGFESLADELDSIRGDWLRDRTLEVISPFFDKDEPRVLQELIDRFQPKGVRVFLPRNAAGEALCPAELYDAVSALPRTHWAQLPDSLLRVGADKSLGVRNVHAKVYRFVDREQEYQAIVFGSHNATSAAYQLSADRSKVRRGNFEASVLIEPDSTHSLDPWLTTDRTRPAFAPEMPSDDADGVGELDSVPLELIFDWEPMTGRACWRGATASGDLQLTSAGILLPLLPSLKSDVWTELSPALNAALGDKLKASALLTVATSAERRGCLLVQEENAHKKPNLYLTMSVSEILEFWSQLSPEQQATFIETRFADEPDGLHAVAGDGARLARTRQTMFDTFAGIFHGFEMLRKQVSDAITNDRLPKLQYLLFGERHDSLPRALALTVDNSHGQGTVERYVFMLCARQLLSEIKREHSELWRTNSDEFNRVLGLCANTDAIRAELTLGNDGQRFLAWFERHFVARAKAASKAGA